MRELNRIIIHATATLGDKRGDVDVDTVRRWHVDGNGWADVGYHFLIRQDGTIERGRELNVQGAHAKGHNRDSVGVAFCGGIGVTSREPEDTRTPEQRKSLKWLVTGLCYFFPTIVEVIGHRDVSRKACPCFDARAEYQHLTNGKEPKPGA
jgi:N-acetylmuramoyl-L-alanine amidase